MQEESTNARAKRQSVRVRIAPVPTPTKTAIYVRSIPTRRAQPIQRAPLSNMPGVITPSSPPPLHETTPAPPDESRDEPPSPSSRGQTMPVKPSSQIQERRTTQRNAMMIRSSVAPPSGPIFDARLLPIQLPGEVFIWTRDMTDLIDHQGTGEPLGSIFLEQQHYENNDHCTPTWEGTLFLSSYRLIFLPSPQENEPFPLPPHGRESWLSFYQSQTTSSELTNQGAPYLQIPLLSMEKIEKQSKKLRGFRCKCVQITTWLGRSLHFSFRSCTEERQGFLQSVRQVLPRSNEQLFGLQHPTPIPPITYRPFCLEREFSTWADLGSTEVSWQLSTDNIDYQLCSTYPGRLIVPAAIPDGLLAFTASLYTRQRFPVATWMDPVKKYAILRSSFPVLDFSSSTQEEDLLLQAYVRTNPFSQQLYVFDVRSKAQSVTQMTRGITTENTRWATVKYLGLASVSEVQESWEKVQATVNDVHHSSFWMALHQSKWFQQVQALLSHSAAIASLMSLRGSTILLQDHTGWNQSVQLASLVELMLSPQARTIRGFCQMIQRQWIRMGHPFARTCGHYYEKQEEEAHTKGWSKDRHGVVPLFVQFLDSVWQCTRILPTSWEFNESLLVALARAAYDGLFPTFLHDCEKERVAYYQAHGRSRVDASGDDALWQWVEQERDQLLNPLYQEQCNPLHLHVGVGHLRLWDALFLHQSLDYPKRNPMLW